MSLAQEHTIDDDRELVRPDVDCSTIDQSINQNCLHRSIPL